MVIKTGMNLKEGTILECVNSEESSNYLTLGKRYMLLKDVIIRKNIPSIIIIDDSGNDWNWFASRFIIIKESKIIPNTSRLVEVWL